MTDGERHILEPESLRCEYEAEMERTKKAIADWLPEAREAIALGDLWRGGGILMLADLMRRHTACRVKLAAMKYWHAPYVPIHEMMDR